MALEFTRRPDVSDCLIHLTKDRRVDAFGADQATNAFAVLKEILCSGILKPGQGYVKGSTPAVCLTETPLSCISHLATAQSTIHKKSFYGLAFDKKVAFTHGARPVIYLPDAEGEWIPKEQKWRHVRHEHGVSDWTHEREWRSNRAIDLKAAQGFIVLVWSSAEATELYELDFEVKSCVQAILPMEHLLKFL